MATRTKTEKRQRHIHICITKAQLITTYSLFMDVLQNHHEGKAKIRPRMVKKLTELMDYYVWCSKPEKAKRSAAR